jgi:hypothetical protein
MLALGTEDGVFEAGGTGRGKAVFVALHFIYYSNYSSDCHFAVVSNEKMGQEKGICYSLVMYISLVLSKIAIVISFLGIYIRLFSKID